MVKSTDINPTYIFVKLSDKKHAIAKLSSVESTSDGKCVVSYHVIETVVGGAAVAVGLRARILRGDVDDG